MLGYVRPHRWALLAGGVLSLTTTATGLALLPLGGRRDQSCSVKVTSLGACQASSQPGCMWITSGVGMWAAAAGTMTLMTASGWRQCGQR
jgi:hypothetical protein